MTNPYKESTQKHKVLEAYRSNGYQLWGSKFHALHVLSHTKIDSELRKDGFMIESRSVPGKADRLHVMTHDPYNPARQLQGVASSDKLPPYEKRDKSKPLEVQQSELDQEISHKLFPDEPKKNNPYGL